MATVPCVACGEPVAADAKSCPRCGKQYPAVRGSVTTGCAIGCAVAFLIMVLIGVCSPR